MIKSKFKPLLSNPFLRNLGWLGSAELIQRLCNLANTVVLARLLSPYDYGLAAVVFTTSEFANVFTLKAGIGSKIIQADEADLDVFCHTAYWLNWLLCGALFLVQSLASFLIAWFYGSNQVILPICVAALVYLMIPIALVQASLLQRENRLEVAALCTVIHSILGTALAIGLAFAGTGMWAAILPGVITTPLWVIINYWSHPWKPTRSFSLERWSTIVKYGQNILGVELLSKLRANLDYLLVGRFLGVEALGVYYFAFKAGLGISLSVMNAFVMSVFPHLCEARNDPKQLKINYLSSLRTVALVIIPLVILQSSLASFYVPIIFGQKWIAAIPILILVCLSALPRPFADASSLLLQAIDKGQLDLAWNVIFTCVFSVALLLVVKAGTLWVAGTVMLTHFIALPLFTFWVIRYVFSSSTLAAAPKL